MKESDNIRDNKLEAVGIIIVFILAVFTMVSQHRQIKHLETLINLRDTVYQTDTITKNDTVKITELKPSSTQTIKEDTLLKQNEDGTITITPIELKKKFTPKRMKTPLPIEQ